MVNTLGHWLRFPFCTSSWIPLRGLSGFRVIGFRIPLGRLSGFRVPPGLLVPAHPLLVLFCRSFEFSMSFFVAFYISGSRCSMVPYRVVFFDIFCQVFLSLFPEYVETVLSDSVFDPIKYHVYCSRHFLPFRSVEYAFCCCIFRCHRCWWLLVSHLS